MNLRDYIGAISRASAERGMAEGFTKLIRGGAALARRSPEKLLERIAGISRLSALAEREFELWAEPSEIGAPDGRKAFDVCDLRIWLELADRAGVDAIPAIEIVRLSEDELDAILGKFTIPEDVRQKYLDGVRNMLPDAEMAPAAQAPVPARDAAPKDGVASEAGGQEFEEIAAFLDMMSRDADPDAGARAWGKIEGVLDELPPSWMVRTHVAGSGNLKALVGTGLMHKADDTARVRPDFEIGGGWVRAGNRRMIDFSDPRFLQTAIGGHKPGISYLARPWEKAGRFHEGEDLHRANSPLAGPGKWPAEWRVFIRNGEVTGSANYYGWTGEGASAQNAWNAIRAAALGQKIADTATDLGLTGAFMDQVFIRNGRNAELLHALEGWAEDGLHATLDFYEGESGLRFLEGGPAHMPGGGGHPCSFAGQGITGHPMVDVARCEGVAYRNMSHVHLGEPGTWVDGDPTGSIETWSQAASRAMEFAELDGDMLAFLARRGVDPDLSDTPEP